MGVGWGVFSLAFGGLLIEGVVLVKFWPKFWSSFGEVLGW